MTALPRRETGQVEESRPVNVMWLTTGLGFDGDSIAMTSATNPSVEDLLRGCGASAAAWT